MSTGPSDRTARPDHDAHAEIRGSRGVSRDIASIHDGGGGQRRAIGGGITDDRKAPADGATALIGNGTARVEFHTCTDIEGDIDGRQVARDAPIINDCQDLARNAMISADRAAALIGDAASDPEVDAVAECRIPADATRIHDGHLRRAAVILGVDPIISGYPAAALVGDAATRDEIDPSADGRSGDWIPRDAAGIDHSPGAAADVDAITGAGDASSRLVGDSAASTQGHAGAQEEGITVSVSG